LNKPKRSSFGSESFGKLKHFFSGQQAGWAQLSFGAGAGLQTSTFFSQQVAALGWQQVAAFSQQSAA